MSYLYLSTKMEDYLVRDTFDEIRAKSRFLLKEKKEEEVKSCILVKCFSFIIMGGEKS